jgi:hypothetical protein
MQAGVAEVEITPPVGIALTGYIARAGPAVGVHDPLYAKALVLAEEGRRAVLITCDVLGLHGDFVAQVRQAIEMITGIPGNHVMITCSHTHAGPATMFLQDCGEVDLAYLALLQQQLVALTVAAVAHLQPARFGIGQGQVTTGVHNRRTPGDRFDPALGVWYIADLVGAPVALVLNYACHPTTLTGENRLISAEYSGHALAQVQAATGATAFFVTGAIGDVGPVGRGWPVLEELGDALAAETLRVLKGITLDDWRGLAVASERLSLPLNPLPTLAWLEEEAQRLHSSLAVEQSSTLPYHPKIQTALLHWIERIQIYLRQESPPTTVSTELQVMQVGPLALVNAPGELFVELGLAIKEGPKAGHLFIAGFGNDNIGYIPTRRAYPHGGYEIHDAYKYYGYPAALAPEAGEQYVATAIRLLETQSVVGDLTFL